MRKPAHEVGLESGLLRITPLERFIMDNLDDPRLEEKIAQVTTRKAYGRSAHGTLGMYTHHKCRCAECRTAWSEYMRERR